jgi:hypothetical protein
MSDICRCSFFENVTPIITNPKCPKFEQEDDEDYVICNHVLIRDAKGYCEINYEGNKHE